MAARPAFRFNRAKRIGQIHFSAFIARPNRASVGRHHQAIRQRPTPLARRNWARHRVVIASRSSTFRWRNAYRKTLSAAVFLDAYELWRPLSDAEESRVVEVINRLELDDLRGRTFGKLSYGQTRRVLLARALVTAPQIVLLDEALDGLDVATRARMGELLGQMAARGTHFAFASHHESDFPDWLTDELKFPLQDSA